MASDNVEYEVVDGRAEITLNKPDKLNAFDDEMVETVVSVLEAAQEDDDVYVIVLTGAGRGFCSGADVTNMGSNRDRDQLTAAVHLRKVQEVVRLLYAGSKPTIAAVNGPALGAGSDWALACDMRVMSEESFLREQFVNIGLIPGDGGAWLLPRLVGEAKAKEYLLTGKDITPEAAVDMGLAVEKVAAGETLERARELANTLRDKPWPAMQNTKGLIDMNQSFQDYCQAAIDAQWEVTNHPEHDEAVAALREGRDPDFDR